LSTTSQPASEARPALPKKLISTELAPSMALFSPAQVQAIRRGTVRFPSPYESTDNSKAMVLETLTSSLNAYQAEPLNSDVLPVAKLQTVIRSASHYRQHGGPCGSHLARYVAELLNEVAEHHPELLTAKAAWEMEDGLRVGLMNFLVDKKVTPDVDLLSPAAAGLLASGLQEETRRWVASRVEMDGDTPLGAWACRLPASGFDMVDSLLNHRAYGRLLEEASKMMDPKRPTAPCAQELLGRLVERVGQVRSDLAAGTSTARDDIKGKRLAELLGYIDNGWSLSAFARHLVSHLERSRWSGQFAEAIPILGRTVGLDAKQSARRFGAELVAALNKHLAADPLHQHSLTTKLTRAAKFTKPPLPNAPVSVESIDFMTSVTDFMRSHDELSADFVVHLRGALLQNHSRLPAELEARFVHEILQAQINAGRAGEGESAMANPSRRRMRAL
jgi:hypothetical protein